MFDAELWSHIQNGGRVSESRGDTQSSIQMRNMREAASIRKGRVYTDCGYIMCCLVKKRTQGHFSLGRLRIHVRYVR